MLLHSGVYRDNQFRKDLQTDPRVGVIADGTRLISYKLNLKIGQMEDGQHRDCESSDLLAKEQITYNQIDCIEASKWSS